MNDNFTLIFESKGRKLNYSRGNWVKRQKELIILKTSPQDDFQFFFYKNVLHTNELNNEKKVKTGSYIDYNNESWMKIWHWWLPYIK